MKLMLGTTELADVSEDIARQIIAAFEMPGRLKAAPQIAPSEPKSSFERLNGSFLVRNVKQQRATVTLELEVSAEQHGPLFPTQDPRMSARERMADVLGA